MQFVLLLTIYMNKCFGNKKYKFLFLYVTDDEIYFIDIVFSKILQKISFITLMKRVISFVCVPISCFWISIHTPAKGVTAILSNLGLLFFNSFHQFPN